MTNTIADATQKSDVIMLVGSNPEEAHPVLGMQIRQAVARGTRLIVVDPRDIGLTASADVHLKIKPGTNVALVNGMIHVIIEEGLSDGEFVKSRTEGFDEMVKAVQEYTPQHVAEICGIKSCEVVEAAKTYATAERASIMYCLGVTEHTTGTDGVMALSNLAMVCGNLGRAGCGVNPLRGQNNVQGACDMGAMPSDFTGYQRLADPAAVRKFEDAWGVKLRAKPGLRATECFQAMEEGDIRGLFLFGEDPMRTDADVTHVKHALECLDFLVVDDLFLTETAKMADVVLPGRSFAEKEGTFTNTERRVQRVRKAVQIKGDTKLDTDIFAAIMIRMGYPQKHLSAAQIMDEIASLTPNYGGISHERLDSDELAGRGLQWPCLTPDHPGTPILHKSRFTRGVGKFSTLAFRPSAEQPDEFYPFIMMTGRVLSQYNARAMTDKTEGLSAMEDTSFIEVNASDAQRLGIADGDKVSVSSRRGTIASVARVSEKTNPGQVWMPFHFEDGNSNVLTHAALDPLVSVPELKVCAVSVHKA